MRTGRAVWAIAILAMLALPRALTRGKPPPNKTPYWVCDDKACLEYTDQKPDDHPKNCRTHGLPMVNEAYEP